MKHKHYDVIIAYANGAKIEYRSPGTTAWRRIEDPAFYNSYEYRVVKTNGEKLKDIYYDWLNSCGTLLDSKDWNTFYDRLQKELFSK